MILVMKLRKWRDINEIISVFSHRFLRTFFQESFFASSRLSVKDLSVYISTEHPHKHISSGDAADPPAFGKCSYPSRLLQNSPVPVSGPGGGTLWESPRHPWPAPGFEAWPQDTHLKERDTVRRSALKERKTKGERERLA